MVPPGGPGGDAGAPGGRDAQGLRVLALVLDVPGNIHELCN